MKIKVQIGTKDILGNYHNLPCEFDNQEDFDNYQDLLTANGHKLIGIKHITNGMDK